jgi:zinc D-Ala-D-Ala carboxypeptidase
MVTRERGGLIVRCVVSAVLFVWAVSCGSGDDGDPAPTEAPSATNAWTRTAAATASPTPAPTPLPGPTDSPPGETPAPTEIPGSPPPPPDGGVSILFPVNKQRALPAGYAPPDLVPLGAASLAPGFGGSLRAEAKAALERMLSNAYDEGRDMYSRSAYRSYAEQERTFAYWVSVLGEAEARRVSAEPGQSEHQLGTAVDLTNADVGYDLTEAFGETPGGRWLMENAHRYGFALSYPAGAEAVTGYAYEPWHWRYIGPDQAVGWKASGLTLGEYLMGLD